MEQITCGIVDCERIVVFAISLFTIRFTIIVPLDVNCQFVIDDNKQGRSEELLSTDASSSINIIVYVMPMLITPLRKYRCEPGRWRGSVANFSTRNLLTRFVAVLSFVYMGAFVAWSKAK